MLDNLGNGEYNCGCGYNILIYKPSFHPIGPILILS